MSYREVCGHCGKSLEGYAVLISSDDEGSGCAYYHYDTKLDCFALSVAGRRVKEALRIRELARKQELDEIVENIMSKCIWTCDKKQVLRVSIREAIGVWMDKYYRRA